jgi:rubredoxin
MPESTPFNPEDQTRTCPKCGKELMPDIPMLNMGKCSNPDCRNVWFVQGNDEICPKCGHESEYKQLMAKISEQPPKIKYKCSCGYTYFTAMNLADADEIIPEKILKQVREIFKK